MSVCVYVTKEKTRVRSESLHARDGQGRSETDNTGSVCALWGGSECSYKTCKM